MVNDGGVNTLGGQLRENRGSVRNHAVQHRANQAQKIGRKIRHYKPIFLPHSLSDSHLPFLHEGFLRGYF
jgi:hypothetical protein